MFKLSTTVLLDREYCFSYLVNGNEFLKILMESLLLSKKCLPENEYSSV